MVDQKYILYLIVVVFGITVNLFVFFAWHPGYVLNDGVQYLSTAENWLNGKGFSTNALMYRPHYQDTLPGPQTVWPPGYPLVLSLAGIFGFDLTTSGLILNLFFHAFASILVFFILKRMRVDISYAIVCALLFYALATPWSFVSGIMTEPLFTCLIFSVILTLPVPGQSKFSNWLLCGFLLACCVYVRYSAALYAASVGAGIFLYLLLNRRVAWKIFCFDCLRLAALIVIPVIAFLQLMYRTHILTGTTDRNDGSRVPESFYYVIREWGAQSSDLLGFSQGGLYSHEVGVLLYFCMIGLIVFLAVYAFVNLRQGHSQDRHSAHHRYSLIGAYVIITHGVLLVVYLSYCVLSTSPLEILARYQYQVYPGIYVIFCLLMYRLIDRVKHTETRVFPKAIKYSLASLVSIYLIAQVNEVSAPNLYFAEGMAANKMMDLPVDENTSLADYINSCLAENEKGSIWSTHGQHLHFHTGKPTLTLAEVYTSEPPDLRALEKNIDTYNIKLMLFLNDERNLNISYKKHLQALKQWLVANGHNKVSLKNNEVNEHITVDVFQVSQLCG